MNLIKDAIERSGKRSTEVAVKLGISKGHLGDLISGRRTPSPELALRFEREFGIPADRLHPTIASVLRLARAS